MINDQPEKITDSVDDDLQHSIVETGEEEIPVQEKHNSSRLLMALFVILICYFAFMFFLKTLSNTESSFIDSNITTSQNSDENNYQTENEIGLVVLEDGDHKTYKYDDYGISFEFPSTYIHQTDIPRDHNGKFVYICLSRTEVTPECDTYIEVIQEGDYYEQYNLLKDEYSSLTIIEGTRDIRSSGKYIDPILWEISGYPEESQGGYTHMLLFEDQDALYTVLSDDETTFSHIIESWGK
jgi:hypothetical protein